MSNGTATFFVGDIGKTLEIRVHIPLTDVGGVATIEFFPPGISSFTRTAVIVDAAAGIMEYTWISGDLSTPGVWKVNAIWTVSSEPQASKTGCFLVLDKGGDC